MLRASASLLAAALVVAVISSAWWSEGCELVACEACWCLLAANGDKGDETVPAVEEKRVGPLEAEEAGEVDDNVVFRNEGPGLHTEELLVKGDNRDAEAAVAAEGSCCRMTEGFVATAIRPRLSSGGAASPKNPIILSRNRLNNDFVCVAPVPSC